MKNDNTRLWVIGGLVGVLGFVLLKSRKADAAIVRPTRTTTPKVSRKKTNKLAMFDPYRVTTKGKNVWTAEGLNNVRRLKTYVDRALATIDGTLTSMYRSVTINKKVGGVKHSPHLKGKAADMVPGKIGVAGATTKLLALASKGKLGPVAKITPYLAKGYLEIMWK